VKNRKKEIIHAAMKRFAKHGLNKTTLDEIARDMRIGKATIYHYFTSKQELYNESVTSEIDLLIETIGSIFNKDEITLEERLNLFISTKFRLQHNFPLIFMLIKNNLNENRLDFERELLNVLFYKEVSIVRLFISAITKDIPDQKSIEFSKILVMQSYNISLMQEFDLLDENSIMEDRINGYFYFFKRLFPVIENPVN
jgi:AcrR family transcriptional regulator